MFVKALRGNYLLQIVFLLGIMVALWLPAFLAPSAPVSTKHYAPFYAFFQHLLVPYPLTATILAALLVLAQAFFINAIFAKNGLITKTTFFQAILYVCLMSFNTKVLCFNPVLCANVFLLLAFKNIMETFDSSDVLGTFFISSFFIAVASLFYFPVIIFWVWILIAFFVYKIYTWQSFFVSLLGLLAPFTVLFTYYFLFDKLTTSIADIATIKSVINTSQTAFFFQNSNIIYFAVIVPLFLVVFIPFLSSIPEFVVALRRKSVLIVFYFLLAFIPAFYRGFSAIDFALFVPILSFVFTSFFYEKKKPLFLDIVAFLLLAITIINVYF